MTLCDGRCGLDHRHEKYECPLSEYWEQTYDGGKILNWICMVCPDCVQKSIHFQDCDGLSFTCMACNHEQFIPGLQFLNSPFCRRLMLEAQVKKENGLGMSVRIVNQIGDLFLEDMTMSMAEFKRECRPTLNSTRLFMDYVLHHLKHSYFYYTLPQSTENGFLTAPIKWYYMFDRILPDKLLDRAYGSLPGIEKTLQREECVQMYGEDTKGNPKYLMVRGFDARITFMNSTMEYSAVSLTDFWLIDAKICLRGKWFSFSQETLPHHNFRGKKRIFDHLQDGPFIPDRSAAQPAVQHDDV